MVLRSLKTVGWAELICYAALLLLASLIGLHFLNERNKAIAAEQSIFVARQQSKTHAIAEKVNYAIRQTYQGLRTIARLPGVRRSYPGKVGLTDDALISAQEIYNNLAENLSVSELYIVPVDFDPEAAAKSTEPFAKHLITFDHVIVGRTAEDADRTAAEAEAFHAPEEIEIFEYREMRQQLEYFKARFASEATIKHLAYPAIISQPVITCDNTHYSPHRPNDDDRTGFIYSVPFYGSDGRLRGIVSAVILKSVFASLLPNGKYALSDTSSGSIFGSEVAPMVWDRHRNEVRNAKPATALPYSVVVPLPLPATGQEWSLWAGATDEEHLNDPVLATARSRFWMKSIVLVLLTLLIVGALRWQFHRRRMMTLRNQELEAGIARRTVEIEAARREAETANTAKSQFLARVSHEIRTPLHAILSATELLTGNLDPTQSARKIKTISNAGRTLLDLVNQLLDLASIEQGRLKLEKAPFSPRQLAEEIHDLLRSSAEQKGLGLHLEIAPGLPGTVTTDPARIRQVLINIAGNALKYAGSGDISIRVESIAASSSRPALLKFSVTDTGPGIPAKYHADLFEPFRKGSALSAQHSEGTGLGLAISKQLVDEMGGSLEFESSETDGSHFWFTIPVTATADAGTQTAAATHPRTTAVPNASPVKHPIDEPINANVLLAEDNTIMQQLCAEILEGLGCQVDIAATGLQAIERFTANRPDIILMDCRMPEMDGLEAARRIRMLEAESGARPTPIIALTANAFGHDEAACRDAGMTAFLSKPFTRDALAATLRRCRQDSFAVVV